MITVATKAPSMVKFARSCQGHTNGRFISMNVTRRRTITVTDNVTEGKKAPVFKIFDPFLREACSRLSSSLYLGGGPTMVVIFVTSMCKVGDGARLKVCSVPVVSRVPGLMCLTPADGRRCLTVFGCTAARGTRPVTVEVPVVVPRAKVRSAASCSLLGGCRIMQGNTNITVVTLKSFFRLNMRVTSGCGVLANGSMALVGPGFVANVSRRLLRYLGASRGLILALRSNVIRKKFKRAVTDFCNLSSVGIGGCKVGGSFPASFQPRRLVERGKLSMRRVMRSVGSMYERRIV